MTNWTKEPPKEPGLYWARQGAGDVTVVEMDADQGNWWMIGELGSFDEWSMQQAGFEWWPIPIQPPAPREAGDGETQERCPPAEKETEK